MSKNDSQHGYDQIKKKLNIENSLTSKKKSEKIIKDIINLIYFLERASVWYARLYGQQHEDLDKSIIKCLSQIRSQETHASIMPTFLAIVIKNDKIPQKLLQLLEIVNFRVYMSWGIVGRTDTGQAWLYKDASDYFHNRLKVNIESDDYPKIKTEDIALEFRLTEFGIKHASDDAFKNSFRLDTAKNYDFYKWQGLKYFLINYEQSLQPNKTIDINKIVKTRSEGKSSDYLSVEHLWATANRANSGENDRPVDKEQKRRVGNFVLLELRLNIQGQKHDLDHKIKLYDGKISGEASTDFEQVKQVCKIAAKNYSYERNSKRTKGYYYKIYKNTIDQNEQNYIDFAIKRWSLNGFDGYVKACEWHNSPE